MKKITTLLLIIFSSVLLFGCGKKDATINRLSRSLDVASQSSAYYMQEVETLKNENAELMMTIDTLKAELVKKGASIDEVESKSSQSTTTYIVGSNYSNDYLSMKFWSDGNNYVGSSTVTWYSDYYCSKQVTSNVIIVSPIIDKMKLSNGNTVFVCMSSNGLVFTAKDPYLIVKN